MKEGRERRPGRAPEEEDGDEEPKLYKSAWEEIRAEFGKEIIGGLRKGQKRLPATLTRGECRLLMSAYSRSPLKTEG